MQNGEAFIFGRSDWQYVFNTFCFGYNVGYKFIRTKAGLCNGNFLGIGADDCYTALVVEESAPYGLLISNGQFVSFHGPDPTMIEVKPSHRGTVRLSNCAFWGPCHQIAKVAGQGTVGFSDCTFVQWDQKKGRPGGDSSRGRNRAHSRLRLPAGQAADRPGRGGQARRHFDNVTREVASRQSQPGRSEGKQHR